MAFAGSWLVTGLAQIQIKLPFIPVPITVRCSACCWWGVARDRARRRVDAYLAQGALGLPFFSGVGSGAGSCHCRP